MITNRLIRLATAIARKEGWGPVSGGGTTGSDPTVAYRNHNPGNLRSSPFMLATRDGFAVFLNDEIGFFALVWDLWKKANGETRTGLTEESTLGDLINVYAPPSENNTPTYINQMERWLGIPRDTKLKWFLE
ncbi:MAG: hypothetical protein ACE5HI_07370 [bacterium]